MASVVLVVIDLLEKSDQKAVQIEVSKSFTKVNDLIVIKRWVGG